MTDPPWGDDALDLFSDLGELAARVLKPGRLLVTLTGKRRLPEVIVRLTEHLDWVWEGAVVFDGPHADSGTSGKRGGRTLCSRRGCTTSRTNGRT